MTSITATAQRATAPASSSRRVSAALTAGALLVIALLLALILAMQTGRRTQALTVPIQNLVQKDQPVNQSTEPMYFPGRAY